MSSSPNHVVSKGYDVPVAGAAPPERIDVDLPETVAATVGAVPGLQLRSLVRAGDSVRRGEPVLVSRDDPGMFVVAPATGSVRSIVRGPDHTPVTVVITRDGAGPDAAVSLSLPTSLADAVTADRDELLERLRGCGLWPLIRERPLGGIPSGAPPAAVFINGMDTEPLAADPLFLLDDRDQDFRLGVALLRRLSDGPVYLCLHGAVKPAPAFVDLPGVELHSFTGPHPSGLPGTHIDRIAPVRTGARYWTVRAPDVARFGECARTGAFPSHRLVAVAGPSASRPGYYAVHEGAPLSSFVGAVSEDSRFIQGTVLSGTSAQPDDYLAATVHTVSVIAEGHGRRSLLGWLLPRFDHPSASRAAFGWLLPRSGYSVDARLHGEARPIVNIGMWDKVMPLNIHVSYLVRAIQAGDLDEAISLGLLDLIEEDVALCSYVDPCKLDVGAVIRRGLDHYASQEGSG